MEGFQVRGFGEWQCMWVSEETVGRYIHIINTYASKTAQGIVLCQGQICSIRISERLRFIRYSAGTTIQWLTCFSLLCYGASAVRLFSSFQGVWSILIIPTRTHNFQWLLPPLLNFHIHFINPSNLIIPAVSWHSSMSSNWILHLRYALLVHVSTILHVASSLFFHVIWEICH